MPVGYSLQVAQTAQSGATGSTSIPFVNNSELVFGDEDSVGSDSGVGASSASGTTSPTSGTDLGTAAAAASASGNSAIIWVSVAGILVAILLALKGKITA
jgi:hypothetical protein